MYNVITFAFFNKNIFFAFLLNSNIIMIEYEKSPFFSKGIGKKSCLLSYKSRKHKAGCE
jgi:hypothetical protein